MPAANVFQQENDFAFAARVLPRQLGRRAAMQEMSKRQRAGVVGQIAVVLEQRHDHRIAQPAADALQPSRYRTGGNGKDLSDLSMAQLILERQLEKELFGRQKKPRAFQERTIRSVALGARRTRLGRGAFGEHVIDVLLIDERHGSSRGDRVVRTTNWRVASLAGAEVYPPANMILGKSSV